MIWLLMGILVLGVLLFVTKPLYIKKMPASALDTELADYLAQIAEIDKQLQSGEDTEALEVAKTDLQRALLAGKSQALPADQGPPPLLLASLFVVFSFAALGLYSMLGRAELTKTGALQKPVLSAPQALQQNADPQHENNMSLEQLVGRLEQRLTTDGNNLEGWTLYARSLMNLGRYDQALNAYQNVIQLSNNNPQAIAEMEQAKQFISERNSGPTNAPGPSQEDVNAAASMSDADRSAMINSMVERLSQKLKDDPKDPDGWIRLLRARGVLGQVEIASSEIETMREIFKSEPDVISQILTNSGWQGDE